MGKNIILCADGTGNKGGYTPSSNVYKIYNAINIHDEDNPQIRFYDNGVGTEKNKYYRGLAGAFGLGFKSNVIDLYVYLAKNYKPGDQVYLLGFSRGAATVRAFAGFIATCGLVKGKNLDKYELKDRVNEAFDAYKKLRRKKLQTDKKKFLAEQEKILDKHKSHGIIPIRFIGVWDTVSSLGFPQKWDKTALGIFVLNAFFMAVDRLSEWVFPHRFYNYELTDNVQYACQALAIDDERTSFWPMVWNEKSHKKKVEQVWFAGMHSNVGGGYHRAGMATVALEWMMVRARKHGLVFKYEGLKNTHGDADVHGRMYNSREGLAIYYRYHPREIEKLCKDKLQGRIRIHQSVIERMERRTANYTPGLLSTDFVVVDNSGDTKKTTSTTGMEDRKVLKQKVKWWVLCRKWLYGLFLETTLTIVGFGIYFWKYPPLEYLQSKCLSCRRYGLPCEDTSLYDKSMGFIADTMNYFLPDFLNGLITKAVIQNSWYFWGTVLLFISYWFLRKFLKDKTDKASEEVRKNVLASL